MITRHFKSVITFLTVGLLSACVYFLSFTLFWKGFKMDYTIAISIGYVFSVIFHFTMNRRFTFHSHGKNFLSHILKYLIMVLINYGVTLLIIELIVETLQFSPYIGIIFSIGTTTGTGYLLSRYWVFYQPEKS